MLPEIPSTPLSRQESEKDQAHRRKLVYKWYKHYAKPTRANMYSIVDFYANLDYYDNEDSDITRQDVDLLPWNIEETEVTKEAMKSKKKNKKKKENKKEKKNLEETEFIKKKAIKLKSPKKTEKKVKKKEKQERKNDMKAEFDAEAAQASPKSVISSMGAWPIQ
jgi:outer membrane biosynthesis protein TonB